MEGFLLYATSAAVLVRLGALAVQHVCEWFYVYGAGDITNRLHKREGRRQGIVSERHLPR